MDSLFSCYVWHGIYEMVPHRHASVELNFVERGSAVYLVDEVPVFLKRGDLLVLDTTHVHQLRITQRGTVLVGMELHDTFRRPLYEGELLEPGEAYRVLSGLRLLPAVLRDVVDGYYSQEPLDYIRDGSAYLLQLTARALQDSLAHRIKQYLIAHYADIRTLADVADALHLSKSHMQRVFRQETGMPMGAYLSRIRMQNAAYLLRTSTLPIGELYEQVGVGSRQAFYGMFVKQYGVSPQAYRLQNGIQEGE